MRWTEFTEGWQVLLLSLLGVAISINAVLLYGFGALIIPLETAFGWDRGSQQVAISFLYGGAVIGLQAVGWLNLSYGIKTVTISSLVLMALGYLACIQWLGGSVWSLYIAFGLLPIIGMGALAITWTQLVNLWFVQHRGLALAIALSGTGITAAIVPGLMAMVIERYNWQAAFVLLAAMNLLIIPLVWLWFKLPQTQVNSNSQSSSPPHAERDTRSQLALLGLPFREGFVTRRFWTCNLAMCLVVSAVIGMVTNTMPILRDRGFSAAEAGFIFSFFGMALIVGRLLVGFFLDRVWPPAVAAVSLLLPSIGCVLFLSGTNDVVIMAVAVAMVGVGTGAEFDIAAYLIARYFGMKDYGRLMGFHQGLITVVSALAPLFFAIMYQRSGSYDSMLMYCVAGTLLGALLLLTLGKPPEYRAVQSESLQLQPEQAT